MMLNIGKRVMGYYDNSIAAVSENKETFISNGAIQYKTTKRMKLFKRPSVSMRKNVRKLRIGHIYKNTPVISHR